MRKSWCVLLMAVFIASGCASSAAGPTVPTAGNYVKKLPNGGAMMPGGVPLPPDAVRVGAARGFESRGK